MAGCWVAMLAPGQRCERWGRAGPILCHRSQWTSSRARSDRSTAHPIAQVKHPVALNHHVGDPPAVAVRGPTQSVVAVPEHATGRYDVHAHLVDQARGKHLATYVTSGDLDDAVTRKLVPGYGRLDAVDEVKTAPRGASPRAAAGASRRPRGRSARRLPVPAVRQVEDVAAEASVAPSVR